MKKLTFLLSILLTQNAFTGPGEGMSGGAGNGGDVIVCPGKVILLDSYEAHKKKLVLNLNPENVTAPTYRSMVNAAVKRLMKKDQFLAEVLYQYSMEMVNDLELLEAHPESRGKVLHLGHDIVSEINDSFHVTMPEGCEKRPRQLVSQRVPKFKLEFRYEINKTLWLQMDLQDRAMTVLHEAWYRIMLENGAQESRSARYMNGLVASEQFDDYSFIDYMTELKETELKNYSVVNNSSSILDETILINLKEHDVYFKEVLDQACVAKLKIRANIKKFSIISGVKTPSFYFDELCFSNSRMASLTIPSKIASAGFNLVMENYYLKVAPRSASPVLHYHPNGKFGHLTGGLIEELQKMFYRCQQSVTFNKHPGCEGPFLHHDSKIPNPGDVKFDEKELPIGFDFPATF